MKTLHSTPGPVPCHPPATPPSLARGHTRSPHPGEERPGQRDSVRYSFVLYPEGHFSPSSEGSRHFLKQKIQEDNFHPWFLGGILPGLPREGRKRAGCVQGELRNFQGQAGERVFEGRARWCRREPRHASQIWYESNRITYPPGSCRSGNGYISGDQWGPRAEGPSHSFLSA